jgi:hypothetical protein
VFELDNYNIAALHTIVFLMSNVLFRCLKIDLLLFDDVSSLHLITFNRSSSVKVLRNIFSFYAFVADVWHINEEPLLIGH